MVGFNYSSFVKIMDNMAQEKTRSGQAEKGKSKKGRGERKEEKEI